MPIILMGLFWSLYSNKDRIRVVGKGVPSQLCLNWNAQKLYVEKGKNKGQDSYMGHPRLFSKNHDF